MYSVSLNMQFYDDTEVCVAHLVKRISLRYRPLIGEVIRFGDEAVEIIDVIHIPNDETTHLLVGVEAIVTVLQEDHMYWIENHGFESKGAKHV